MRSSIRSGGGYWFSRLFALLAATVLVATGCATEVKTSTKEPAGATAAGIDYLNVGDKVRVVFDIPVSSGGSPATEMQIPENGELTLHLGHKFIFKGKKRDVLEQEIRSFYVDKGLYKIINVTIEVLPRPITVGGEVRAPKDYPHQGQLTVLKAIDMAGGFTEYANKKKVMIIRNGKTIVVDCKKALQDPAKYDVPVFAGDSINVKKGW